MMHRLAKRRSMLVLILCLILCLVLCLFVNPVEITTNFVLIVLLRIPQCGLFSQ